VLFVQGNGCPIARGALPALRAAREEFAPQGVVFWMLNANTQDDREAVAKEAEAWGIDLPVLLDDAQLVARGLGITRTAEAIVIDPRGWRIVYRGPVDDGLHYEAQRPVRHHWLRDALRAHLEGRSIDTPVRDATGCLIHFPERNGRGDISYADEIAPLLERRCRSCHHEGGVAPWSMSDYVTVRGWSPMMREMIRTRRMPPWHADPHFARFANDISLSSAEKQTLVHWIEAGAPRGNGPDPLAEHPPPQAAEWPLGAPDLVLAVPVQSLPASGVVPYLYETVEIPVARDVWIRNADLRPSNPRVMHHGVAHLVYPDGRDLPETEGPRFTRGFFGAYVPGREPAPLPPDAGFFVPAGSRVRFQLHYTTTGRPETDAPRLALYLSDVPLAHELKIGAAARFDFEIPPGAEDHEEVAVQRIDRDIVLYRLSPHMHYRGKRMRYDAHYPDGRVETLLSVPSYNFNWQRQYVLDPPRHVPAGTKLVVTAAFDNSERNPANPDPGARVTFGEQTWDEMLFGYFLYRDAGADPDVAGSPAASSASAPAL
jgi:hypothetical protein